MALWLGRDQVTTTQVYLHADMTHKQRAIERTRPLGRKAKADKASTDAQGADATSSAKPSGTKVARRRGRAS